jgi:hypothetical protein
VNRLAKRGMLCGIARRVTGVVEKVTGRVSATYQMWSGRSSQIANHNLGDSWWVARSNRDKPAAFVTRSRKFADSVVLYGYVRPGNLEHSGRHNRKNKSKKQRILLLLSGMKISHKRRFMDARRERVQKVKEQRND